MNANNKSVLRAAIILGLVLAPMACFASDQSINLQFGAPAAAGAKYSAPLEILLGLSLLSLAPALLFMMTAFTRIVIVLSMLRHAIGMPETPPTQVLVSLAIFLTIFTMMPVLDKIYTQAYEPYKSGSIGAEAGVRVASGHLRDFMVRQTREQDLMLMVDLSHKERPRSLADVSFVQLIPAYMLSELKTAFQIGFVIFLPFMVIDLVVSSLLMSLGMLMMPPASISLPLKILMFVLIDGWSLLTRSLVGSFIN
jgi:flagellar biosynthetic protein FliP